MVFAFRPPANDDVVNNYPGLGFIDLLLKATTTVEILSSFAEATASAADVSTPDLIVDCIAGWVNASITSGLSTISLEELLGEECMSHLGFHIVTDESGFAEMRSKFAQADAESCNGY
jgi:hypothetical protein